MYHIRLYRVHLTRAGTEFTTLVVINIGSYKSNYHTITTAPFQKNVQINHQCHNCITINTFSRLLHMIDQQNRNMKIYIQENVVKINYKFTNFIHINTFSISTIAYKGLWCLTVFINISVISWWSVLLVEETGVPGENHRPVVCH